MFEDTHTHTPTHNTYTHTHTHTHTHVVLLSHNGHNTHTHVLEAARLGVCLLFLLQVRHRGTLLLDPTTSESSSGDAEVHVCVMPSVDEITQLNVTGCWVHNGAADGQPKLNQALQLALGGCMQLRDEMRTVLLEKAGEQKQANGLS